MEKMECNKGFSSNYMLLKPEEVKLIDLMRILFSSNIAKMKFVDSCGDKNNESFERRWIIFVSIVIQKTLQFISKPLAFTGKLIEMWLNLLPLNGSFGRLLLNALRGKVVMPDEVSATFLSFTGNFNKRMELDEDIQRGDVRYQAALAMMASKASYENKAYLDRVVNHYWKMEFVGSFDYWNDYQDKATTQAFLLRDDETIVVTFRGTETFDADAWCSNFDISWYELHKMGRVHGGFMKALGLHKSVGWPKQINKDNVITPRRAPFAYYAIREMLREMLTKEKSAKFIVTGHSQGGALAILFPAILALHEEKMLLERLEGVYTFGQPRVGDDKFAEYMKKMLEVNNIKYYRFVYCNDIVPRLPYDDSALMFKHFGTCVYYDRHYQGWFVSEEPNKNYFSPLSALPMMWNAAMEVIRSFKIQYKLGPDYAEGWFMRVFRIIGLVVPGVPAHSPHDYVNATCLGSASVFYLNKMHD